MTANIEPVWNQRVPKEVYLVTLGEIGVTNYGTVVTPYGAGPLAGSAWSVSSSWNVNEYTPGWAIVMFLLTVWFFGLGTLFLFCRSTAMWGTAVVTVSGPGVHYTAYLPITAPAHPGYYQDVVNRLNAGAASRY